jgi:hypothetical protein
LSSKENAGNNARGTVPGTVPMPFAAQFKFRYASEVKKSPLY